MHVLTTNSNTFRKSTIVPEALSSPQQLILEHFKMAASNVKTHMHFTDVIFSSNTLSKIFSMHVYIYLKRPCMVLVHTKKNLNFYSICCGQCCICNNIVCTN